MPKRIQLSRRKGWRLPDGAVNVARPTKWGNPFVVGEWIERDSPLWPYLASPMNEPVQRALATMKRVVLRSREQVVECYAWWLIEQPLLMMATDELKGRDLACWCPLPKPGQTDHCHAAFLLETANEASADGEGGR